MPLAAGSWGLLKWASTCLSSSTGWASASSRLKRSSAVIYDALECASGGSLHCRRLLLLRASNGSYAAGNSGRVSAVARVVADRPSRPENCSAGSDSTPARVWLAAAVVLLKHLYILIVLAFLVYLIAYVRGAVATSFGDISRGVWGFFSLRPHSVARRGGATLLSTGNLDEYGGPISTSRLHAHPIRNEILHRSQPWERDVS